MNKLDMEPPLGGGVPQFSVRTQRIARQPTPWMWAIYKEGWAEACHCSSLSYRSAEEAWAVGRAMLHHMKKRPSE
jgi:hypothetical protein